MSDLEIDPAVGRLVTAWLDKHDPDRSPNQVSTEVLDFTPRPARQSMSDADRRLAGALRKQKLDAQRERTEAVDDTEAVDSRAKAVVQKRRGPGRPRKHKPAKTPNPIVVQPKQVDTPTPAANADDDFGRPEHNGRVANGNTQNGQADAASNGEFKKRKKIRSRQKNLRRDNRPKDQLPPHLTEETLHGGRVRKEDTPSNREF